MKITKKTVNNIVYLDLLEIWDLYNNSISECMKIINHFTDNTNLFLYLYREYGSDMNDIEIQNNRISIPKYFSVNGRFQTEHYYNNKTISDSTLCAIGCLPNDEHTFDIIPKICDYYLETLIFEPNNQFSWEDFSNLFRNHALDRNIEILLNNNCSNIIFSKVDDGDFSIIFNNAKIDENRVLEYVLKIE